MVGRRARRGLIGIAAAALAAAILAAGAAPGQIPGATCRVPAVVGEKLRAAEDLIDAAGCTRGPLKVKALEPHNIVMSQSPRAGTVDPPEDTVYVNPLHPGHKLDDSGFKNELVFVNAKVLKPGEVFVRAVSRPRQPIYGTYSVNCFRDGLRTVYARDGAWDAYGGSFIRRVKLPKIPFDSCHLSPLLGFIEEEAVGKIRGQVFVRRDRPEKGEAGSG
jgi:hypothetical protein